MRAAPGAEQQEFVMHLSRLMFALLAVLGLSFATAPLANAVVPTPPASAVTVKGTAQTVGYYERRSYEDCDRPYVKRYSRRYYYDDHYHSAYRPAKRYRYWNRTMQRRYYAPRYDYDDGDYDRY